MDELEKIRKRKLEELMKMAEKTKIQNEPIKLDSGNFDEVTKKNENVVVDFWAEWCMPCRYIAPVIEELAKEYAGKVIFGKLNVDENQNIATRFGISAIPTLIFFKNGKAMDQIVGAMPKKEIKKWIDTNIQRKS
ncbi:MAG: thioredoxin [Archaeoglobaceae archaeon]|nr:thioredoxin [Archaeoglobaceae archaeon]MDW8117404.1 thioredoxin [Archaeoglobaceae archaeon]